MKRHVTAHDPGADTIGHHAYDRGMSESTVPVVHILHENPEWIPPLTRALDAQGVPWREWPLTTGSIDLGAEPPAGIYWSRLSASSHTRGHDHAKAWTPTLPSAPQKSF